MQKRKQLTSTYVYISASRLTPLRSRRMVGGTLAPHVPWQAMVYLADSVLDGGYAGGALISDRWVLTAGRNLFVKKSRQDIQGRDPLFPKVYLGISSRAEAGPSKEVIVEKVSKKKSEHVMKIKCKSFYLFNCIQDPNSTLLAISLCGFILILGKKT